MDTEKEKKNTMRFLPPEILREIFSFCDLHTKRKHGIPPGKIIQRQSPISFPVPVSRKVYNEWDSSYEIITEWNIGGKYRIQWIEKHDFFNDIPIKSAEPDGEFCMERLYGPDYSIRID